MAARAVGVLGLDETFPRPGWVVLDAAREQCFSGEIEMETTPPVRVYFDRGRIYLAERISDPPLGARLVDSGALDAVQLSHGTVRIGDVDHLGRLFERSPSVDRHAVMVTLELMTEEATSWVAAQTVRGAAVTPYQRHPSGVHRWERVASVLDRAPGSPLPAPDPLERPAATSAPVGAAPRTPVYDELDGDIRIVWHDPAFAEVPKTAAMARRGDLVADDGSGSGPAGATAVAAPEEAEPEVMTMSTETADAVAEIESMAFDVLSTSDSLSGFEVIWPSGEVDDGFTSVGDVATVVTAPAAPTVPIAPAESAPETAPAPADGAIRFTIPVPDTTESRTHFEAPVADEVVLAVRRAIAAIESGFTMPVMPESDMRPSRPVLSMAHGSGEAVSGTTIVPSTSEAVDAVIAMHPEFDRPVEPEAVREAEVDPAETAAAAAVAAVAAVEPEPPVEERKSALRRLIAGLRRR